MPQPAKTPVAYDVEEVLDEVEWDELMKREPVLDWTRYIHIDPDIAFGKPMVRGTRMAAEFILDLYALGWTDEKILESYPHLDREALRAIFAYAADCVAEQQQPPPLPGDTV